MRKLPVNPCSAVLACVALLFFALGKVRLTSDHLAFGNGIIAVLTGIAPVMKFNSRI